MTGAEIVVSLLRAAPAITDAVPADQIKAGALTDDAPLPSLLVRSISEVERLTLRRRPGVRITERVDVTVRAGSYRLAKDIRILVRETCAGRTGNLAGALRVAVTNAGAGPELIGPNRTYERSQDFRVSFETAT